VASIITWIGFLCCIAHATSPPASLVRSAQISSSSHFVQPPISSDTVVNYCRLIHAGYHYGQEYAWRRRSVSVEFLAHFNDQWSDVFTLPAYQQGINTSEFAIGSRFSEGNHDAFPPSSLYPTENPDTYMTFHLAKEIGMVQSPGFEDCPSCVQQSIAKVGAYLAVTPLNDLIADHWPYLNTIPRIRTMEEVDTLWMELQCLFGDIAVDPKGMDPLSIQAPKIDCEDTLTVRGVDAIIPVFKVTWLGCATTGTSEASAPLLTSGKPGKRRSVYCVTISARSGCNTTAQRSQYFVLR
jgi:hypothetical protein